MVVATSSRIVSSRLSSIRILYECLIQLSGNDYTSCSAAGDMSQQSLHNVPVVVIWSTTDGMFRRATSKCDLACASGISMRLICLG